MPQFHQILEILPSQFYHCQWLHLLLFPTSMKRILHLLLFFQRVSSKRTGSNTDDQRRMLPMGSHKGFSPLLTLRILLFMGCFNLLGQKDFGNVFATEIDNFGKEQQWGVLKAPTNPRAVLPWDCSPGRFPVLPPQAEPSCLGSPAPD